MYYRAERDQTQGSITCLGLRSEIQDLNRPIDFPDSRRVEQRMVHYRPFPTSDFL
jgi:hypothetical protein